MSKALKNSLSKDPLSPIIWQPHLEAIDRRIEKILFEIRKCVEKHPINDVIISV